MKINVKKSTLVIPAEKTQKINLWISNLDLIMPPIHPPVVYLYRPNGAPNFFDAKVMKDALSRVLVAFYPLGGRLKEDKNGRIEIYCQGQGVMFVEAESDGVLDDFGEYAPTLDLHKLTPTVDYSQGIESYPLMVSQVTYFQCGGVSLGVAMHHYLCDASSLIHFVNSWSEIARGLDITLPPMINRTLLRAREPPQPVFQHIEYQAIPWKSSSAVSSEKPTVSIFKLTREQLNVLKMKSREAINTINYSTFLLLIGHIWKCVCKARGLPDDQETKLYVATEGRARHQPALPPGYFGNVVLKTCPTAVAQDIHSNPSWYAAKKIHDELVTKNSNYIKSIIDYLELLPDLRVPSGGTVESLKFSNLAITSLVGFPVYDADFGWGRPIFMGPNEILMEGLALVLPNPIKDGSLSIVISLQAEHMKLFSRFLYESLATNSSSVPSKL